MTRLLISALALAILAPAHAEDLRVTEPPEAVRATLKLAPFYKKYVSAGGFPVVGSEKVSDSGMLEAAWLIGRMLDGRDDILKAMIANKVRCAVMAIGELTTDIPEHGDLTPKAYWDRRARGLGATPQRPAVRGAEENLLCAPGDPYREENILIHEFAHAIHEMGMNTVDPSFDTRLAAAYASAMKAELWQGKYAATNRMEYWAEGVQSWFDTNRVNDRDHNHVHLRAQLKEYDPALAALIAEVFGDKEWRYTRPTARRDLPHLRSYDPAKLPAFAWPINLAEAASGRDGNLGASPPAEK